MADKIKERDDKDEIDDDEDEAPAKGVDKPEAKAKAPAGEYVELEPEKGDTSKPEGDPKAGEPAVEGDERLSVEEQGEDLEAKRARRRQEKQDRKARQRHAREARDRELEELRATVTQLTQGQQQVNQRLTEEGRNRIKGRIEELRGQVKDATALIAKAGSAGNGEVLAEALGVRDEAAFELRQLGAYLQQQEAQAQARPRQQQTARSVPPAVVRRTQEFSAKYSWYDGKGSDDDSAVVLALDARVAAEGYDPAGPEYWAELDRRIAAKLPHRAKGEEDEDDDGGDKPRRPAADKRGPQLGSGRSGANGGRVKVFVSAERRKAMEEAGIWDDPARRAKQIRAYAKYDQEHAHG